MGEKQARTQNNQQWLGNTRRLLYNHGGLEWKTDWHTKELKIKHKREQILYDFTYMWYVE